MLNLRGSIEGIQASFENVAGALIFPALVYLVSRFLLEAASKVHWILGALVAVPFIALIAALLLGLSDDTFRRFPGRVTCSLFATVALTSASVCAWASFALWQAGRASYSSSSPLFPGSFADYYIWIFIDMVPSLKVWETLDVKAPIQASGVAAGLPVLVFRLLVVLPLLAYLKKWWRIQKQQPSKQHPIDSAV